MNRRSKAAVLDRRKAATADRQAVFTRDLTCETCGRTFTINSTRGHRRRYCDPTCRRKRVRRYLMTSDEFDRRLAEQRGACLICLRRFNGSGLDRMAPQVDHDHQTGRVRGLLCRSCNTALGMLRDDVAALRRAADYIEAAC